jgi:hypothetical protein
MQMQRRTVPARALQVAVSQRAPQGVQTPRLLLLDGRGAQMT